MNRSALALSRASLSQLCLALLLATHIGATPPDVSTPDENVETPQPRGTRRALLVGCTAYPNLKAKYSLKGSTNDVLLTAETLTDPRYGYAGDDIVTLIYENEPEFQPTRAHIIREFSRLVEVCDEGDEVVILLAGHGGQQADMGEPDGSREPDGLDEVFLPQDLQAWKKGVPPDGGITDDEIGEWLDALRAKGAFVLFIADTCHSGSISRGPEDDLPDVRSRILPRGEQPVPVEETGTLDDDATESPVEQGGLITLFAVPARDIEKEQPLPSASGERQVFGRLTYALNTVLQRLPADITYRELAQHLRWYYQSQGWYPTAYLRGDQLGRTVLGRNFNLERSRWILTRENKRLELNVGLAHEIGPGSVFAVYPPAGQDNEQQLLGYVEVTQPQLTWSIVEPCEFDGMPAVPAEKLTAPARCELARRTYESATLPVAVVCADPERRQALAKEIEQAESAVGVVEENLPGLIELVDVDNAAEPAELVLVVDQQGAALRRLHDSYSGDESTGSPLYGPFPFGPDFNKQVSGALVTAARAINFKRLADLEMEWRESDPAASDLIDFEIDLQVARNGGRRFVSVKDLGTLELTARDTVRITVNNIGRVPVDVNVLYVESGFAIRSYMPTRRMVFGAEGWSNTVLPEKSLRTQIGINTSTLGAEHLVVIVTESENNSAPADFVFLEQCGLAPVQPRGLPNNRGGANGTPLDQLLERSLYKPEQPRGSEDADIARYAMHRATWRIVKPKKKQAGNPGAE